MQIRSRHLADAAAAYAAAERQSGRDRACIVADNMAELCWLVAITLRAEDPPTSAQLFKLSDRLEHERSFEFREGERELMLDALLRVAFRALVAAHELAGSKLPAAVAELAGSMLSEIQLDGTVARGGLGSIGKPEHHVAFDATPFLEGSGA